MYQLSTPTGDIICKHYNGEKIKALQVQERGVSVTFDDGSPEPGEKDDTATFGLQSSLSLFTLYDDN